MNRIRTFGFLLLTLAAVVVPGRAGVAATAQGEQTNFFLLFETPKGVEIRNVPLETGRTYTFDSPDMITYVPVFPVGSKSGDLCQKATREGRSLRVRTESGLIHLTLVSSKGVKRELPDIDVALARSLDIRISVTGGGGYTEAFRIRGFQSVEPDNGPILDIFADRGPLQAGDYSLFMEMLQGKPSAEALLEGSLPFELRHGWMVVNGRFGSGPSLTFVLDLGAASSVVTKAALPREAEVSPLQVVESSAKGTSIRKSEVAGATGMTDNIAGKAVVRDLELGGLKLTQQSFLVLDSFPEQITKRGVDGIIGLDVLQRAGIVSVKNPEAKGERGTITLTSKTLGQGKPDCLIPLNLANGHIYLDARLQGHPLRMVLDSGSSASHVSGAFLEAHHIATEEVPRESTKKAVGLDGQGMEFFRVELPGLELGNCDAATRTVDVFKNSGPFDVLGTDSLLGMDFLSEWSRFEVDYEKNELRLWH